MNKLFPSGLLLSSPGMENFIPPLLSFVPGSLYSNCSTLSVISCPSWHLVRTVGQDENVRIFPLLFSIFCLVMAGTLFVAEQ